MKSAAPIKLEKLGTLTHVKCGNITLSIRCSEIGIYIRMDDEFAKGNGYNSIQDADKSGLFNFPLNEITPAEDGYVWLYFDENSHDFFGISNTAED